MAKGERKPPTDFGGIGHMRAEKLIDDAAKVIKADSKAKQNTGRKRGGQPGNKNRQKNGVYTRMEAFEQHFESYSRAMSRSDASEELALIRGVLKNLMKGKTPLGDDTMDDWEELTAYFRDFIILSLKGQELLMRQEARKDAKEEKNKGKQGTNVVLSREFYDSLDDAFEASTAEPMDAEKLLAEAKARAMEMEKGNDEGGA